VVSRYWWPGIATDATEYVRTCARCQKASTRFDKSAPEMKSIEIPSTPWTQIGIDLCSLPKSPEGFVGIVVAVDYFTKWVEAEPIRDKTANTVASFLYSLICRHGCANVQINDQGREFVNGVAERLHQLTGVKQRITSAYHPQVRLCLKPIIYLIIWPTVSKFFEITIEALTIFLKYSYNKIQ
jgi:hypothetical protein